MEQTNSELEQVKQVLEAAPCGIGLFDAETGETVFLNRMYYSFLGCTPEEYRSLYAQSTPNRIYAADRMTQNQSAEEFAKTGRALDYEYRVIRKNGSILWLKMRATTVDIGARRYAFVSFTDITREKEVMSQFALITENTDSSVSLFRVAKGRQEFLYANDRFYEITGISAAEYNEKRDTLESVMVTERDHVRIAETVKRAIASGQTQEMEHPFVRPDGKRRWVSRKYRAVPQEGPDTYMLVAIVTDITKKKEAEITAKLEQQRFRLVIDEMNAAVFEWNLKDGSFYCSAAYQNYAISSVDPEKILRNCGPADVIHPDDSEKLQTFFHDTKTGKNRVDITLRLKLTNGNYHWCHLVGFFCKDENGHPSSTIGVIVDVNKEYEHSFMLDNLLNELPGGVAVFTVSDHLECSYFSDGFAAMSGRSREEVTAMLQDPALLEKGIPLEYYREFLNALKENKDTGKTITFTDRFYLKDGTLGWLHVSATKIREENGNPVYYCVFTNPTDETALYRSVVEDSAIGVFVADRAERKALYNNGAVRRICGIPDGRHVKDQPIEAFLQELGEPTVLTEEEVRGLCLDRYTEFHRMFNGRFLAVKAKALMWNGVDSYILYIADETNEHEHQKELQKLVNEVPAGVGIYEIEGGQLNLLDLNDAYYQLLGIQRGSRSEYKGTHAAEVVYPEDRPAVAAMIRRLQDGENSAAVQHRILNGKGKWIWLNLAASVVERRGSHLKVYVAFTDCDNIVRAQKEMEKNQIRERTLMASIPGGVAIYRAKKDGHTVVEYVSEGLCRMLGYSREECLAATDIAQYVLPQDKAAAAQAVKNAICSHQPISVTYRIVTKSGQVILNHLDGNVMDTEKLREDELAVIYAVHTRVSEKTRQALQEQTYYRMILDMTGTAYFEWARDGGFYASESFRRYALWEGGYEGIMGGSRGAECVYPDDLAVLKEYTHKAALRDAPPVTVRMKMQDGSYQWTEVIGYAERDEQGRFLRLIGVLRNVDKEWQEQKKKLQDALDMARKANQAKTVFLSRVSHDMRTPLNGILGLTALMKSSTTDPQNLRDITQLEISGEYLLNLINDTLDMSRIESGCLALHPSVCDGREFFRNLLRLAKPNMEAKHLHFSVQAENLPFTMLYMDVGRVEQILMNILGNAVKFTPEGGTVTFTIENVSVKNGIITDKISVRDTGIGMSPEFLPTIFDAFSQADTAKTNARSGTGLGMAITKQLLNQTGGEIFVESELGKGSCFTVLLPMQIATNEQIEAWKKAQHAGADDTVLRGRRVLLCEDHPINVEVAVRLLKAKGMEVEVAGNGQAGVDCFQKSAPYTYDIILMDIRMPVMDGLKATRTIRALPREDARDVPIIAMTANAFDDDVRQAREAGMNAHLSKPISPGRLYDELEKQLRADHHFERRRVLVVDDLELNRAVIRLALEQSYDILEAGGGAEALALMERNHVDAVITDIQMPEMNGTELIRRIRANPDYHHIAIVANTQYGESSQEEELLALGANDFIYKPTTPEIVRIRVRNALKKI